jgi:hypothetical protein
MVLSYEPQKVVAKFYFGFRRIKFGGCEFRRAQLRELERVGDCAR